MQRAEGGGSSALCPCAVKRLQKRELIVFSEEAAAILETHGGRVRKPAQRKRVTMMTSKEGTSHEERAIWDAVIELQKWKERILTRPSHRSYSTAVTKIEEAIHWLHDRRHQLP